MCVCIALSKDPQKVTANYTNNLLTNVWHCQPIVDYYAHMGNFVLIPVVCFFHYF